MMYKNYILSLVLIASTIPTFASAENLSWVRSGKTVEARSYKMLENQADYIFIAKCLPSKEIEILLGADYGIGMGNNESVSVQVSATNYNEILTGHSKKSINFDMTTGRELKTTLKNDAPFLLSLAKQKGVKISKLKASKLDFENFELKGIYMNKVISNFLAMCK